jgi:hypothetical protein
MQAIQLELNLWNNLEAAAAQPLAANMNDLWQELEAAIAPVPQQLKLQIAAQAILRIAQIHASRAQRLLDDWEEIKEYDDEPVLNEDMLAGMLRQTMVLDLDALLEPPPYYPRSSTSNPKSVAGVVDKVAMLEVLDQMAVLQSEQAQDPTQVAHSEDISAWAGAISQWMKHITSTGEAITLIGLQQLLEIPLIEVWLGLLLSVEHQYEWEQRGDFYEPQTLWLRLANAVE